MTTRINWEGVVEGYRKIIETIMPLNASDAVFDELVADNTAEIPDEEYEYGIQITSDTPAKGLHQWKMDKSTAAQLISDLKEYVDADAIMIRRIKAIEPGEVEKVLF